MSGSITGKNIRVSTWGESHGKALGCVIDGFPAGLDITEEDIQKYLDRRKPGTSIRGRVPETGMRSYRGDRRRQLRNKGLCNQRRK